MDKPQPIRLRLSRTKGFDLQLLSHTTNGLPAKSVARPGPFGNPWTEAKAREAGYTGTDAEIRVMCAGMFRHGMRAKLPVTTDIRARISELAGHNLACWCPLPKPGEPDHCHAAVLLEVANG
jgi:hypothetical protein